MAETALITGASSGIGEALARRFAGAGFNLVLVARSADKLKALAVELAQAYGIQAKVHPADLTQPGAAEKLAAAMKRSRRHIDVLVNNAGVLEHGEFTAMQASRHRELIDLNVTSLSEMLAQFLPPMQARGAGRVLNVASIAAFQPIPMLATYAATKAYVLSLTESLSEELKGSGVTITALCPGITATSMLDKAQAGSSELETLPGFVIGTAEAVADEGYEACMAGEVIRVPGKLNLAATLAGRSTPRWLVRRVTGAVSRRLKR
ncbi:SDR family NAD(P)-dependent oxidoreductase [Roseateles sp. NT4]|uniref:SDR family NAD(P)-dependent oxidoreductase n=1 Tax=Roseateles sp. NT4 TaxID=3453715 RepID=UPI003EEFB0F0